MMCLRNCWPDKQSIAVHAEKLSAREAVCSLWVLPKVDLNVSIMIFPFADLAELRDPDVYHLKVSGSGRTTRVLPNVDSCFSVCREVSVSLRIFWYRAVY